MQIDSSVRATFALVAATALAACSGGFGPAPRPDRFQNVSRTSENTGSRFASHLACPAKGPIFYVSDPDNNAITVYKRNSQCGLIGSGSGLNYPVLIYVQPSTHDLYVANWGAFNILVFHRGQTVPFNTYTDPSGPYPLGVTLASDGTVIASNGVDSKGNGPGSISTWIAGANGGTFVGNFKMTSGIRGGAIAIKKNGAIYYDQDENYVGMSTLWTLRCPRGVCGPATQIAGVSFGARSGLAIDDTGDLLAVDQNVSDTFELPNPNAKTFPLQTRESFGVAINAANNHLFITDQANNVTQEYAYPRGSLLATVPGISNGASTGVAIDP
jgi:DNA-binding beta-propeller fold protein YncE